jgi:small-conductance mechanosensitive channel
LAFVAISVQNSGNIYMDIQQAVNLDIFQQFHEAGIEFAYPTQTLLLERQVSVPTG